MPAIMLFVLLLSSGSAFCAARYGKRYERVLPITALSAVMVLFLFGLCGLLKAGVYAVLSAAAVLYLLAAISLIRKKNGRDFLKNFATPAMILFLLTAVGFGFLFRGKLASSWDEYTHWVDVVKVMTMLDDFGTNPASGSFFASYTPGMSLFQYLLCSLYGILNPGAAFREDLCNVAFHLLAYCVMAPLLRNCRWKKPVHLLACCVVMFLGPLLFYSHFYFNTYIDPVQGILPGVGMAVIFLFSDEEKDGFYQAYILLLCMVLSLIKEAALAFSVFLAVAFVLDHGFAPFRKKEKGIWLRTVAAILAAVLPQLLWKLEVQLSGTVVSFGNSIDLRALTADGGYRIQVARNFMTAMYENTHPLGNSGMELTFITWFFLCLLGLCAVYLLHQKTGTENLPGKAAVLLLTAGQTVAYLAGLCVMYMFKFTRYEALNLAAMDRYICVAFLCCWMLVLFILVDYADRYLRLGRVQMLSCILAALLVIPTRPVIGILLRNNVQSSAIARSQYTTLQTQLRKFCAAGDTVYLVSQGDGGMDLNALHFIARPVNISNKICNLGEPRNEGDIYTAALTAEEWQQELVERYDYVAILALDPWFLETYGELFEDAAEITENSVYRVDRQTGMLSRCEEN